MTNQNNTLPNGPWTNEPDQEVFTHQGTFCAILRHCGMGFVNGYICIDKDHPWFGLDDSKIDSICHGGVTYACNTPPTKGLAGWGKWWVGFDTGHTGDLTPPPAFRPSMFGNTRAVYRDWEYVRNEVKILVADSQNALYEIYLKERRDMLPESFYNGDILKLVYTGYTAQFYRFKDANVERWNETQGWAYAWTFQDSTLSAVSKSYKIEIIPLDVWKNKMAMRELEFGDQL